MVTKEINDYIERSHFLEEPYTRAARIFAAHPSRVSALVPIGCVKLEDERRLRRENTVIF